MRFNLKVFLVIAVLSGMLLFNSAADFMVSLKKPVDFNELTAADFKDGLHVEGDVKMALDIFAGEETWTEKNGKKSSKKTAHEYYILPIGAEGFMAIEGNPKQFSTYDKIMDETYDYVMGTGGEPTTTLHFSGRTEALDADLTGYFEDWFVETEFLGTTDTAEIQQYVIPYILTNRSFGSVRALFALGVVLALADIAYLALCFRKRKVPEPAGPELG